MIEEQIAQYSQFVKDSYEIDGYLDNSEGLCLYLLARYGSKIGRVVEIGSFQGKSTYWLASGVRDSNDNTMITIDHHNGNKEHNDSSNMHSKFFPKGGTKNIFKENMEKYKLMDWITPMYVDSMTAASKFNEPIRLLFIDGSHEYQDIKNDVLIWGKKVVSGGIIVIHDSSRIAQFEGPKKVVGQLMAAQFDLVYELFSMTVLRKRPR